MKKVFGTLAILLIAGLVLSACFNPVDISKSRAGGASAIVWKSTDDKVAAAEIIAVKNDTRKNASGPKITSNAHSADFPGIYFIWDSKQADCGYLKVDASVFEMFDSFILTAKESNSYWDFVIEIQDGQEATEDDCYVFFIPKVKESGKNINMVFVSDYLNKDPNEKLKAEIETLYASESGTTGRLRKMQAFIMELALHAKLLNPEFKIIVQDGIDLAFEEGDWNLGGKKSLIKLVDGWGIEGVVGSSATETSVPAPNTNQQKYTRLTEYGLMVTDTTSVTTSAALQSYYNRARAWNIIPFPRIGGTLASADLFPGWRWSTNTDYFWVEDPATIGIGDRVHSGSVVNLTDARNYLYHINGRPYDAWDTWDAEEAAAIADGEPDRTYITDGYACGLLVPFAGGRYTPSGSASTVNAAIAAYGSEWDWWWRAAGYSESQGREVWLEALRDSWFDVIYIDTFYNHRARPENQTPLTKAEVDSLKYKPNGARRQIIGYLSIGSAEQNRWYCQDNWINKGGSDVNSDWVMRSGIVSGGVYNPPPEDVPTWLALPYGGSYAEEAVVQWWHPEWRAIIINGGGQYAHKTTGDNTSSIDRIINQGFDGVYLDNVGVYNRGNWVQYETWLAAQGN